LVEVFFPAHFSIETMMAGKMIACLERNFQKGKGVQVKGRDFYDLIWFMQRNVKPLEEKLNKDGRQFYTTPSAMILLGEKIDQLTPSVVSQNLIPLFEKRSYIEAWLESFKENFYGYKSQYVKS